MPDGINLITRRGTVEDLAECYSLHRSLGLPYTKRIWHILPDVWPTLLSKGAMQLCLVANRSRPVGSQIVSFNAILFVTDEFCSEARFKLRPYLGVELAEQYPSGELPILSREQVARANAAAGLNVVLCFEGWALDRLSREEVLALRAKQSEAFHLILNGYHVKEFLAATTGREASQWMLDAGARLRRNYSNYFRKNGLHEPESSQRPWLVGLTKEEALRQPGRHLP